MLKQVQHDEVRGSILPSKVSRAFLQKIIPKTKQAPKEERLSSLAKRPG